MKRKVIIAILVSVVIIIALVAVCTLSISLEDEAKAQAVDFAQRYVRFDIHRHNHDLQVSTFDENYYLVIGTIKKQTDLTHLYMTAILELRETEKLWLLDTLVIDSVTLYSRD